jgi:hypothetical protein
MARLLRGVTRMGKTPHVFQIDAQIQTVTMDGNLATGGGGGQFKVGFKKKGGTVKYTHAASLRDGELGQVALWAETLGYTATLYKNEKKSKFQSKEYIFEVVCERNNSVVGTASIDLASYANVAGHRETLQLPLARCRDPEAVLKVIITSRWLQNHIGKVDDADGSEAGSVGSTGNSNDQDLTGFDSNDHHRIEALTKVRRR